MAAHLPGAGVQPPSPESDTARPLRAGQPLAWRGRHLEFPGGIKATARAAAAPAARRTWTTVPSMQDIRPSSGTSCCWMLESGQIGRWVCRAALTGEGGACRLWGDAQRRDGPVEVVMPAKQAAPQPLDPSRRRRSAARSAACSTWCAHGPPVVFTASRCHRAAPGAAAGAEQRSPQAGNDPAGGGCHGNGQWPGTCS